MSKTGTAEELLVVALQDLRDAARLTVERVPQLGEKAGDDLTAFLADEGERSQRQVDALTGLLDAMEAAHEGDANIWQRAILDDAKRDGESIVAGPLRDTALIGALRKGKQATRVSYETAIALAEALGRGPDGVVLTALRDAEAAADDALEALLMRTVAAIA